MLELEGERFRAIGTSGLVRTFDGQQFEIQPGPSLFREVIATGRAAFTNDAIDPRIDARFRAALQIRQAAVAPIVLDGGVSGLLLCINSAYGAYSSHDIEWLGHLADHSALVLRHQRLIRRAQDAATDARSRAEDAALAALAARHNAVLARTARVLAEAKSRDAVYTGIADVLHDELRAAGMALYEASPPLEHARLEYQWGAGTISPSRVASGFGTSGLGDVVRNATSMFIEDLVEQTDRHQSFGRDELLDAGMHALALLPLVFDGQPRGLLSVRHADTLRFDEEERRLLMDIAMQVTIAYRNVNYLADLERRAVRLAAMARATSTHARHRPGSAPRSDRRRGTRGHPAHGLRHSTDLGDRLCRASS